MRLSLPLANAMQCKPQDFSTNANTSASERVMSTGYYRFQPIRVIASGTEGETPRRPIVVLLVAQWRRRGLAGT
jgi:hypothetical protein